MGKTSWMTAGLLAMCVAGCNTPGVSHEVPIHDGHHDEYKEGRMHEEHEADEMPVGFELLPQAVKDTLAREAPGVVVPEVEQETKHGKTIYEVDVMIGGKNYELKIAPDGKVISKKEENDKDEKEEHGEHGGKGHKHMEHDDDD